MKRFVQVLLAATLCVVPLTACGNDDSDNEATARTLSYDDGARKNLLDDPVAIALQKELGYVAVGWQNGVRWHPDLKGQWFLLFRHCGAISVPQACFKQVKGTEIRPDLYFMQAMDGDMSDAILWRVEYLAARVVAPGTGSNRNSRPPKRYTISLGCQLQSAAMVFADHTPAQRTALMSVTRLAGSQREWSLKGESLLMTFDHPDLPPTESAWWCESYTAGTQIVATKPEEK